MVQSHFQSVYSKNGKKTTATTISWLEPKKNEIAEQKRTNNAKKLESSLIFSFGFHAILLGLTKFYDVIKQCFATFWMLTSLR